MAEQEPELEKIARLTYAETQSIRAHIEEDLATKADLEALVTKAELRDMEDRLVTHLTELKADIRQVIADETANTVAIAKLHERVTKLEKRAGLAS